MCICIYRYIYTAAASHHIYAQPSTRVITTFAFTRRPTCQGFDTHHPHTWGGIPRGCSPPLCKPTSVQRFGLHTQAQHSHHCHIYAYKVYV